MDMTAILVIKPTSIIYYTRFVAGIVMGVISTLLYSIDPDGWLELSLAITAYLLTYYVIRFGLRIDPNKLSRRNQILTLGIGTFFLTWILVWVLTFTLLNPIQ